MTAPSTREQVLALHEQGLVPNAIAHQLGTTPSTVHRALRDSGVQREHSTAQLGRRLRAEQAPDVRRLVDAGVSATQICAQLNLGYDTLRKIASEHGIELPKARAGRPSKKDQVLPRVREMLAAGQSQTEICAELNLKLGTLANWIRDEQIEYRRISRHDATANLGSTSAERAQSGAAGGRAAAANLAPIYCLYPPCGALVARERADNGRLARDRYCSREHAYAARREGSGKTRTYTCQYEPCEHKEFTWWTNQPRRFCSKEHYHRANKTVPKYGFEGQILDGGYEAAFVGLCSVRGISFEFFDRAECVGEAGALYGPDFKVDVRGTAVYVDTKGAVRNSPRWAQFRAERGRLVILRREDIDMLMKSADTKADVLAVLKVKAIEQEHS